VLLRDNRRIKGTLQHYNLHYNVALVSVKGYRARRPLNSVATSYLYGIDEVAAVGRCFESCELMATSGEMVGWTGTLDCEVLMRSTCKITKVILYFYIA
jgi:small nuclear ribonucleoprotein (snRNP)-like protein